MDAFALQKENVNPSTEVLLVLGIVGFYLYDSAMLIYSNELIFEEANGQWTFWWPGSSWQLLGKNPYLPNPLTPYAALFRVCWSISEVSEHHEDQERLRNFAHALTPLRYMVVALLVLLVVELPLLLFYLGTGLGVLFLLGAIYLTIVAMLVLIYRRREVLELSPKAFTSLALESLACAPFAINVVRKIALHRSLAGDPVCFANETFSAQTFAKLVSALCQRLDEDLELEDEGSSRHGALIAYRDRITSIGL